MDITQRPQIVEDKRRVGDWEADTIVGAGHRGALVSVVDRASKFTVLHPVSSRSAGEVGEAMMERLMPYVGDEVGEQEISGYGVLLREMDRKEGVKVG